MMCVRVCVIALGLDIPPPFDLIITVAVDQERAAVKHLLPLFSSLEQMISSPPPPPALDALRQMIVVEW